MTRILIAGIGNIFLGDDAFGVEAVRRLAAQAWPEGVALRDFGIRCLDLAFALGEGWTAVVVLDAVQRGQAPGTLWHLLLDAALAPGAAPDGHIVNVESARALTLQMGLPLPEMHLIGCEPQTLAPEFDGDGLSPPVTAVLPEALQMTRDLVMALRGGRAVGTVGPVGAEGCEIHAVAARPRQTTRRGPDRAGAPGVPGPVERQAGRAA